MTPAAATPIKATTYIVIDGIQKIASPDDDFYPDEVLVLVEGQWLFVDRRDIAKHINW